MGSWRISDHEWEAATEIVSSPGSVVVLGHINPDPDALGSALAVGLALEARDIPVAVSCGHPQFEIPATLAHLPGGHLVGSLQPADVSAADTIIVCDSSSPDRLGHLLDAVRMHPQTIAIDHHATHEAFAQLLLVDDSAPATAVLVADLLDRLGAEFTADIATCLYAAVVSDTGGFRYRGTTAATHELAARLLATGFDHVSVVESLRDMISLEQLEQVGEIVRELRVYTTANAHRLLAAVVPIDPHQGPPSRAFDEVLSALIRVVDGIDVTCVAVEQSPNRWKLSLRSQGIVNVSIAAVAMGGGGHVLAAGATIDGTWDEVAERLLLGLTTTV